jgi:hypothetical protein
VPDSMVDIHHHFTGDEVVSKPAGLPRDEEPQ